MIKLIIPAASDFKIRKHISRYVVGRVKVIDYDGSGWGQSEEKEGRGTRSNLSQEKATSHFQPHLFRPEVSWSTNLLKERSREALVTSKGCPLKEVGHNQRP